MRHLLALALLSATALPASAEVYLSRCKMEECVYYDQTNRKVVGEGSRAVPGKLVSVRLRSAATYGDENARPRKQDWDQPFTAHFFCSPVRPAFEHVEDGSYTVINLAEPAGATDMVTEMYMHACHPGIELNNPTWADYQKLGYRRAEERTYGSFSQLVRK